MEIKIINKSGYPLPEYATEGAAGFDIRSMYSYSIEPHDRMVISTGLYFQVPQGYELQIRPRSGLVAKYGITVLNSPGTIDSDYRGEVCVIIYNTSNEMFNVEAGDRIAQGVIARYEQAQFKEVDTLDETDRGSGGFGHTGEK